MLKCDRGRERERRERKEGGKGSWKEKKSSKLRGPELPAFPLFPNTPGGTVFSRAKADLQRRHESEKNEESFQNKT
jgi:hypothetical protein